MKEDKVYYVPALPGFSTIELIGILDDNHKDAGYEPYQRPIIAWKIVHDSDAGECYDVTAVTPQGSNIESLPIVYPNGRVERVNDYDCESVEGWIAMETARRAKPVPETAE